MNIDLLAGSAQMKQTESLLQSIQPEVLEKMQGRSESRNGLVSRLIAQPLQIT